MTNQSSPATEHAEAFEALREIEVAWLSRELGRAIKNLAYPVGCGAAPTDYHLEAAAKALFERYAKMIEMARSAAIDDQAARAPDRVKVARALCRQYELDDGFNEEQADRAAASDMHRNFLKAADAAIAACGDAAQPSPVSQEQMAVETELFFGLTSFMSS